MRRITALLTFSLLALSAESARAQQARGFATDAIDPAERGSRWFVMDSLDIQGDGRAALGLTTTYNYRSAVDWRGDDVFKSVVRNQVVLHMGASFMLGDRVRAGLDVPLQVFADGHFTGRDGIVYHAPLDEQAVGDARLSLDMRILGKPGDAFTLAAGARLHVPSGSVDAYTGDGQPRFTPQVLMAGEVGAFVWGARLGSVIRGRDEQWLDARIGTNVHVGASVGLQAMNKKLIVGPEVLASTVVSQGAAFDERNTPVDILLGAHYDLPANLRLGAAVGTGATRAVDSPTRMLLSIDWVPGMPVADAPKIADKDKDGIADDVDACPLSAGPASPIAEKNGCPLNDLDKDGVPDDFDACPCVAGIQTNDPKTNGCPGDRDGDGIPDTEDACVDEPGVRSLDKQLNGCPERDKDKDGVLDKDDACPNEAGIKTTDPKTNGCPDSDRDKDGIPNDQDACPDEKGPANSDPKKNGCPKAFLKDNMIQITDQVKFDTGSARISAGKDSEDVLVAIYGVLVAHPEVKKVRVEGHTDNVGVPANNQTLSEARAKAVVAWLVAHKVDPARLEAKGFGDTKPLVPNDSDANKAQNRRVELHVEEGAAK